MIESKQYDKYISIIDSIDNIYDFNIVLAYTSSKFYKNRNKYIPESYSDEAVCYFISECYLKDEGNLGLQVIADFIIKNFNSLKGLSAREILVKIN